MKTKNTSDYVITLIVVACSAVLLLAMGSALLGINLKPRQSLTIDMPSATGIRSNSEVRYAGAPIGKVVGIRALEWEERTDPAYAIRITANINRDTPPLKQDSYAEITSDTLLAEKFINLVPGTPGAPERDPATPIRCLPVASLDDLTRAGQKALDQINEVIVQLRTGHPDLADDIASVVENAQTLSANADALMVKLNTILENNEENLSQSVADLNVVMKNLKVVSTHAKALTATLGQKPWRVMWGSEPNKLPSEEEILKSNKPIPVHVEAK